MILKAPFPWFGGKSRVADLVWQRFGNVPNYVEPFAGSLAVLLGRPHAPQTETVNDRDAYLANFWRALQADPEGVWANADQPVLEVDLHARHVWLLGRDEFRERMLTDPHFYDVKIAGWWVWGLSLWIGDGWCASCTDRPTDRPTDRQGSCQFSAQADRASTANTSGNRARIGSRRPTRQLPELASRRGIIARTNERTNERQPVKCRSSVAPPRASSPAIGGVFDDLAARLRDVRIVCGDWSRVVTPSVTWRHGITAVLLDPPYSSGEHSIAYGADSGDPASEARAWAIENGERADLRIALCGYDGEHEMPENWSKVAWKAQGGYGSQGEGRGRENAKRETIWFSPACLQAKQPSLFTEAS